MHKRHAQQHLTDLLNQFAAVVLLGPRQTGKTTLAFAQKDAHANALYLDLELPSAQRQLDDPEAFFLAHPNQLVILDEVQRIPEIFSILRGVIDQRRRQGESNGQFLLLGSASGVLLQQSSESLAGRVAQVELTPFQVREVLQENFQAAEMNSLWVRGGFPLSWLAKDEVASMTWREVFITTYLEKTSRRWAPESLQPPCAVSGRCWPTTKENCWISPNWQALWPSVVKRLTATSTFCATSCLYVVFRHGAAMWQNA